jgi:hypothetical protein
MSSYETERDVVERFLLAQGISRPRLSDPNQEQDVDTGADVLWTTDRCVVGFQVTEYHSDEGRDPHQRGSRLRHDEKHKAATGGPYAMATVLDPIPAIASRIARKIERARHAQGHRFAELILLIVSSRPQAGGAAAGFLLDMALDLSRLNAQTHESLCSVYTCAYIFNMLSLGGTASIYQWTPEGGWVRITLPENAGASQPNAVAQEPGLHTIEFLRSLGGPCPAPGSLSDGLDATFMQELLETIGDRQPTAAEIEAFERSWRERHRT